VQLEGATVSDTAKVEISAGPGEVMETSIDPTGRLGEVKVWLPGPPTPQDFQKWSQQGQVDVNFWWQNPDGSLAFDRRMRTGAWFSRAAWRRVRTGATDSALVICRRLMRVVLDCR